MSTVTRTFKIFNREIRISIFTPKKKPTLDVKGLKDPFEMTDEIQRAITRRNITTKPVVDPYYYARHPF